MKILLVRVSSLGDVLHNMALVADILSQFPQAQIDWVVEENFSDLVRLHPGVRDVIPFALRRWRKNLFSSAVRKEMAAFKTRLQTVNYDLVLDTQGLLKTGLIMGLARGLRKVGLANGTEGSGYEPLSRLFHTTSVSVDRRTHAVQRGRLVAAAALGYQDRLNQLPINFGLLAPIAGPTGWQPPSTDYIVFFHGTAGVHKKWPLPDWISLGQFLQKTDRPILLAWGNQTEQHEAQALAKAIPTATVLPRLSMLDAIVLAQRASLVIGVDTGLTHIAAAYRRPTIEIYAASPRWKTEGNWDPQIINLGDQGQPPSASDVIDAATRLLDYSPNY